MGRRAVALSALCLLVGRAASTSGDATAPAPTVSGCDPPIEQTRARLLAADPRPPTLLAHALPDLNGDGVADQAVEAGLYSHGLHDVTVYVSAGACWRLAGTLPATGGVEAGTRRHHGLRDLTARWIGIPNCVGATTFHFDGRAYQAVDERTSGCRAGRSYVRIAP